MKKYPPDGGFFVYNVIASTGHSSTQVPQSMHVSGSTTAVSSSFNASTGHTSTHAPHAVHFSLSIVTVMIWGI
jgi:hypothetical protein